MANLWELQRLTAMRRTELEQQACAWRYHRGRPVGMRQALGWGLMGLGARLALGSKGLGSTGLGSKRRPRPVQPVVSPR